MEKSQPIVIIAENTTSVVSDVVELFNTQGTIGGDYEHTGGRTEYQEELIGNYGYLPIQHSADYFNDNRYSDIPSNTGLENGFVFGNSARIQLRTTTDYFEFIKEIGEFVATINGIEENVLAVGNLHLINGTYEDSGERCCIVKNISDGSFYFIYEGTYQIYQFDIYEVIDLGGYIVEKSSGIPNVDLRKIYADILGGAVYVLSKVRIECISTNGDKKDVVCQPITYGIRTSEGDAVENPIYPTLSVLQKVECADVELNGLLLNSDTILNIASIPPHTKVRYMFYASEKSNPTITAFKTDLDKELIIPELNKIDGVSQEKVLEIQSQKTDVKNPNVPEKDKKCSWLWLIAVGIGIFATYKLIKD